MISPWFTYGLQPGSALILIASIGTILCLMTIVIDYAEIAVGGSDDKKAMESGSTEVGIEMMVLIEMIIHVTCLGYGVIVRGIRSLLLVWIVAEAILMFVWEVRLIWFLIEALTYDIAEMLHKSNIMLTLVLFYFIIYTVIYYGYGINLGIRCLPLLSEASSLAELEPIGKGVQFIIEHFKTNVKSWASLALMTEIMMNFHVFLERHVTQYGLGFDYMDDEIDRSTALTIEETFVRYIRVAVCIVGFVLVYKERQLWMFNWCIAYLSTLVLSMGIFFYMVFMWRAVHTFLTLIYFSTFALNILYRTVVLYACVRYSDVFERRQGIPL